MTIRSICPEFWAGDDVKQFDLAWVHDGPLLGGSSEWGALHPTGPRVAFVYLFADDEDLLYVGKAWNVYRRVEKHRRKPWWGEVSRAGVVAVYGHGELSHHRHVRTPSEQDAYQLEAMAIHHLQPTRNIARPRLVAA